MRSKGNAKDSSLPKTRVTLKVRKDAESKAKKLGLINISEYVRYCVSKDLEG